MIDLNFMSAGCEPGRGVRSVFVVVRRSVRRVLRPMLNHLSVILIDFAQRLQAHEQQFAGLAAQADALDERINALARVQREAHEELLNAVADISTVSPARPPISTSRVEQIARRIDELDDKLQAIEALHWDHVALARRLAVIEDLLAAASEPARDAIDDLESNPAIPFPGLETRTRAHAN